MSIMNQSIPEFEYQCKGCVELRNNCGTCPKCTYYGWAKPQPLVAVDTPKTGVWYETKDRMPNAGDFIVKRWTKKNSSWSGKYSGSEKDVSFDKWLLLPKD